MLKEHRDPRGGLSAAGRRYYRQSEGANLKPGVRNYHSASLADKQRSAPRSKERGFVPKC